LAFALRKADSPVCQLYSGASFSLHRGRGSWNALGLPLSSLFRCRSANSSAPSQPSSPKSFHAAKSFSLICRFLFCSSLSFRLVSITSGFVFGQSEPQIDLIQKPLPRLAEIQRQKRLNEGSLLQFQNRINFF